MKTYISLVNNYVNTKFGGFSFVVGKEVPEHIAEIYSHFVTIQEEVKESVDDTPVTPVQEEEVKESVDDTPVQEEEVKEPVVEEAKEEAKEEVKEPVVEEKSKKRFQLNILGNKK